MSPWRIGFSWRWKTVPGQCFVMSHLSRHRFLIFHVANFKKKHVHVGESHVSESHDRLASWKFNEIDSHSQPHRF